MAMTVGSVGLFCSASDAIDVVYMRQAREVGALIGRMGLTLVYGGVAAGLMEAAAEAAASAGAHVAGVVPEVLVQRNRVSRVPHETIITRSLSDRKDCILSRSDVLLALPGGVGTLDEIFHVIAAATAGCHSKRVVLYNDGGFWNGLLSLLGDMQRSAFMRCEIDDILAVVNNLDDLEIFLRDYEKGNWNR